MDFQNISNTINMFLNNNGNELLHFLNQNIRFRGYNIINNLFHDVDMDIDNQGHNVINMCSARINQLNDEINRCNQLFIDCNRWNTNRTNINNFIRHLRLVMGLVFINQAMINVPNNIQNDMLNQVQNYN